MSSSSLVIVFRAAWRGKCARRIYQNVSDLLSDIEQVIVYGTKVLAMVLEEVLVLVFSKYAVEEVMVCRLSVWSVQW